MSHVLGERAVVLGGGMAGLLAARVLAEAYRDVVVIDRDSLSGVGGPRRGVPHGRHAHALLARGQQILEELFPGLVDELIDSNVPAGDIAGNLRWYFHGHPLQQGTAGLLSVSATRPQLEEHVRRRVVALDAVRVKDECSIDQLIADAERTRITGVRITDRTGHTGTVDADLVVDATGRGSRTPVWLDQLGYRRPSEDRVKIDLAYTTRHYRLQRDPYGDDLSINPVAYPENPRGAFFPKLADGTSQLSLTGILGDHPPRDEAGFAEFVKSLAAPEIYDAVRDAEPVDEPVTFRFPASVRRRYERLRTFPEGLLVIGDGVCSFNPVYGQGMTVAAMEAVALREHLAGGVVVPTEFFQSIAPIIDVPWEVSASADLAFPGVAGRRSPKVRMGNAYLARLHRAARHDSRLSAAFFRVAGLVDPPQALMRPRLVRDVLRHPAVAEPEPAESAQVTVLPSSDDGTAGGDTTQRAA